jgi:DNA-binding MarR family transcriptional regulator
VRPTISDANMTKRKKTTRNTKLATKSKTSPGQEELPAERLGRELSTTTILFHQAVAARLGLTGTDHKYLMLIAQGVATGGITPGELAAITGLTSGGVTVMLDRLEAAGFITRRPHQDDRRQVVIGPVVARLPELDAVFKPLRARIAKIAADYSPAQMKMIAGFMERTVAATTACTLSIRSETALRNSAIAARAAKQS